MKITKRQLRRIIKEEKARLMEQPQDSTLARTTSQYGPTQGGNPQSYSDFDERVIALTRLAEDLSMDYVDSNWLADGDHASLAADVEKLYETLDRLSMAATGLAQSMGEI